VRSTTPAVTRDAMIFSGENAFLHPLLGGVSA
jgi:hypothetical protein